VKPTSRWKRADYQESSNDDGLDLPRHQQGGRRTDLLKVFRQRTRRRKMVCGK
jgi:hypothetical protein